MDIRLTTCQITARAACAALVASSCTALAQTSTTLLCEARVQGQVISEVLKIDYGRRTVNGNPAVFTESEIAWTTAAIWLNTAYYLDHHLNRLSGRYYRDSRGLPGIPVGPPPSFTCERAPAQRF